MSLIGKKPIPCATKRRILHDVNAKNAGNKARNDVESIVKEEGYHPLILSVDTVSDEYPCGSTPYVLLDKPLDQLKQGDELLIQFPMCFTTAFSQLVKKRKKWIKVYLFDS